MRVPKSLCKKCPHLHDGICDLDDLEPCRYIDAGADRDVRIYIACCIIIVVAFLLLSVLVGCARQEPPEPEYHWSAVELLKEYHGQKDGLTEWEKLQLAIILTESKGNPDAVGKDGDYGLYQMRECFVEEVNRISGSNYSHEDAFDMDNAIDMFNRLQSHYNSEKDIEKAIAYHNHGSAYRATVLRNLELVERMEVVRQKLIEYEKSN